MKLAEALQIRADLQKRLLQIPNRLTLNATKQEGTNPAENPVDIIREMDDIISQLQKITTEINLANSGIKDSEGETMTSLLARRDYLRTKTGYLRDFISRASDISFRHQSTDILILPTIDVVEYRKRLDHLSKELRDLELKIQSLNWTSEITTENK